MKIRLGFGVAVAADAIQPIDWELPYAAGEALKRIKNPQEIMCVCIYRESLFRATPTPYGGSQARGRIRAAAAGLHHSHSHTRSEPCLWPAPQLTATPGP